MSAASNLLSALALSCRGWTRPTYPGTSALEQKGNNIMNSLDPLNQHRQLTLSQRDKKLMGVCGGVAEYMGWDPTAVRIITVLLLLPLHFTLVIAYVILGAVLPKEPAPNYPPNQYPPQYPPHESPPQHPYD